MLRWQGISHWVLFVCFSLFTDRVRPNFTVPQNQINALIDLYNATNGDYWYWLQPYSIYGNPWNFSQPNVNPCSSWQGIVCSNDCSSAPCTINRLILQQKGLYGTIPNSIVNLTDLTVLYLGSNYIYGSIPSNIGELSNLEELVLEFNMMDGSIPDSITLISSLAFFYFNGNQFTGTIPSNIGNISALEALVFDNNHIGGAMPSSICDLTNIIYFSAVGNLLIGTIPDNFHNSQRLQSFVVANNELTGTVPASLFGLPNLFELVFYQNFLNGTIPSNYDPSSTLELITLFTNMLTSSIPTSVTYFPLLASFDVHGNSLSYTIPVEFNNCLEIIELLFYDNLFSGRVPAFTSLPYLNYVDFGNNFLNGTIPDSYGTLSSLQELWFADNMLTGTIPNSLLQLQELRDITLGNNSLVGPIPNDIDRLISLQYLELILNDLTGTLPASLGNMVNLTVIDLKGNHFNGTIPPELGNLFSLQYLFLSSNELTGTIPASLGQNLKLIELWLNTNHLEGSIPKEFGQLKWLQELWLYGNFLDGSLPIEISHMVSLQQFEVDRNLLTGTIPAEYGRLGNLTIFGANSNLFNGSIPDSFGDLTMLVSLVLNSNLLTGTIPDSLQNLTYIIYISLYSNQFTGTVPNMVSNMTALLSLWLYDNYLYGTIPPSVNRAQSLKQLYLQENFFSGSISSSLQSLRQLEYAMFYLNHFSGSLPPELFEHWPNLLYFSVYGNALTGKIPPKLSSTSSFEVSMNFDQNFLSGSIPDTLINTGKFLFFSASLNCITGSLSSSWCNNNNLVTLILDGIHASPHCSRPVFSGYPDSAFLVSDSFAGFIPPCLLNLPKLDTVHLSGINLQGVLPEMHPAKVASRTLKNLVVSHNSLTGNIPISIWSYPFVSLDLSFNRLTGTVPSEMVFNYSDNSTSLAIQVNRLSGVLPEVWINSPNVNVLEGNMFSCESSFSATTQNLPVFDTNADSYQCGSLYTNYSLLAAAFFTLLWVILLILILWYPHIHALYARICGIKGSSKCCSVLGFCQCCRSIANWFHQSHELFHTSFQSLIHLGAGNQRWLELRYWVQDMREFLTLLSIMVIVLWLIGVPMYATLSKSHGTYSLQYVWSISLTFISGVTPAILMWVFLLCLMNILLLYAQWYRPVLWKEHFFSAEKVSQGLLKSIIYIKACLWKKNSPLVAETAPENPQQHHHGPRNSSVLNNNNNSSSNNNIHSSKNPLHSVDVESSNLSDYFRHHHPSEYQEQQEGKKASNRVWLIRSGAVLANIVIVLTVNAAYIVAIETQPNFVAFTLLSITVSLFKVIWNNSVICNNALGESIIRNLSFNTIQNSNNISDKKEGDEDDSNTNDSSTSTRILFNADVQVMLVVSNNILAPLIAAQVVSSSCFEYAVTRPPEVSLSLPSGECYFYEYNVPQGVLQNFTCSSIDELEVSLGEAVSILDTVSTGEGGMVHFYPGFTYSYQCSSALLQAFMYIFVMRFIFSAMILPVFLAIGKIWQQTLFERYLLYISSENTRSSDSKNNFNNKGKSALIDATLFRILTKWLPPILRVVSLPKSFQKHVQYSPGVTEELSSEELITKRTDVNDGLVVAVWMATNVDILQSLLPTSLVVSPSSLNNIDQDISHSFKFRNLSNSSSSDKTNKSTGSSHTKGTIETNASIIPIKGSNSSGEGASPIHLAKTLRVRLISDVAMLISFAVLFPPLSLLVLLAMVVDLTVTMLFLGRLLHLYDVILSVLVQEELRGLYENCLALFVTVISICNHTFTRFYRKLWRGILTVVYLGGLLWGFALLDTLGNVKGGQASLWILLLTCSAPAWLSLTINQIIIACWKYFFPSPFQVPTYNNPSTNDKKDNDNKNDTNTTVTNENNFSIPMGTEILDSSPIPVSSPSPANPVLSHSPVFMRSNNSHTNSCTTNNRDSNNNNIQLGVKSRQPTVVEMSLARSRTGTL